MYPLILSPLSFSLFTFLAPFPREALPPLPWDSVRFPGDNRALTPTHTGRCVPQSLSPHSQKTHQKIERKIQHQTTPAPSPRGASWLPGSAACLQVLLRKRLRVVRAGIPLGKQVRDETLKHLVRAELRDIKKRQRRQRESVANRRPKRRRGEATRRWPVTWRADLTGGARGSSSSRSSASYVVVGLVFFNNAPHAPGWA